VRKLLVGLLCAGALSVTVPAQAQEVVLGSFVSSEVRSSQPHRVYWTVTAGKGSKTCDVTLVGKTVQTTLGTDKQGDGMTFFLRVRNAQRALVQAQTAPSPTSRIVCTH